MFFHHYFLNGFHSRLHYLHEWFPLLYYHYFIICKWLVGVNAREKNEEALGWCECKRMNQWLVGMVGVLLKKFVEEENDEKKYTYVLEEVPTR